ncbi:hypothetical protein WCN91_07495 [Pseudoalteromonas sp. YIC-827]|uniref:Uncharacterized protein n=1 Tax=Pseudoalteromonas qingdaonensis TaxID=3131913 RepID=A0ABU9MVH4_9GAMM
MKKRSHRERCNIKPRARVQNLIFKVGVRNFKVGVRNFKVGVYFLFFKVGVRNFKVGVRNFKVGVYFLFLKWMSMFFSSRRKKACARQA